MRKFFLPVIFIAFFLLFTPKAIFAQERFITSSSIYYEVKEDGATKVTHYITLENATTDYYATSYSLNLVGNKPNSVNVFEGNTSLEFESTQQDDGSHLIKVLFPNSVVGKGAKREFNISYIDTMLAQRNGSIWEISIPKLAQVDNFKQYNVNLAVPISFGDLAYISPEPKNTKTTNSKYEYSFSKNELTKSTVSAAFGNFQLFSFDLTYHLENPLSKRGKVEIALPPDTAFQRVILQKLDPAPSQVYVDEDGNWLAEYILSARQRIDVKAQGAVEIYAEPHPFNFDFTNSLSWSTDPTEVWQTQDPQIQKLSQELKTPRAIYDYVVRTLDYDYDRVKPNISRLGAAHALKNPKRAICMEFTDLFVAIARAAGIPAREVNGYAYTENPEIQPLSLVADVLHSWPEYWDPERKIWVPVDPTWGDTTGGIDFFTKLDLRHFTFVNHSKNAFSPFPPGSYKLGPNPQKDVMVNFGTVDVMKETRGELTLADIISNPLKEMQIIAKLTNEGQLALYDNNVDIYFDTKKVSVANFAVIPPFGSQEIKIAVPFFLFGSTLPETISFVSNGSTLRVPTNKPRIIAANIASLLLILIVLLFIAYVKLRSRQKKIAT